jgi:phage gpG-like protein
MDLQTLQAALARLAAARGQSRYDHPRNLALALAAEAGAVLDRFRWLTDAEAAALDDEARNAVARTAVDAMLYAMRLATRAGVDLATVVAERLEAAVPATFEGAGAGTRATSRGDTDAGAAPAGSAPEHIEPAVGVLDAELGHQATEPLAAVRPAATASATEALTAPGRAFDFHGDESAAEAHTQRDVRHVEKLSEGASDEAPTRHAHAATSRSLAPSVAPSAMVAAASAAFARAQAAAARVQQTFAPSPPPADAAPEPPEEDEFESTITLDAGPAPEPARTTAPLALPADIVPLAPAPTGQAHAPDEGAPDGAEPAPVVTGGRGSRPRAAEAATVVAGESASAPDHPAGAADPVPEAAHDRGKPAAPGDRHEHEHRDATRAEPRPHAPRADDTGSHSGGRQANGRHADRNAAMGSHGAHAAAGHHGKGNGREHGERQHDKRHGNGPHAGAAARAEHGEARGQGHGERHAVDRRTGHAADHGGRKHHDARGEPADARGQRAPAPAADRYAKLDLEAVQTLRKSMARMLEGVHRKDPLLRELAEELETLRRTLYSNAAKPAWIADTLLTIRRMLEESVGEGLGGVLDAKRRIAAIDALLN